jgi:hypothetical protein
MRPETNEVQRVVAGFAINQNQIRPHVAIPVVLPLAPKRMVPMPLFERLRLLTKYQERLSFSTGAFCILESC